MDIPLEVPRGGVRNNYLHSALHVGVDDEPEVLRLVAAREREHELAPPGLALAHEEVASDRRRLLAVVPEQLIIQGSYTTHRLS